MLDGYTDLVQSLSDGKLPAANIAVMGACERGKLVALKTTTTQMVYDPRWKNFCRHLYRVIRGKGLQFLAGSAH